jgi:CBS-domain-containing membrane protein
MTITVRDVMSTQIVAVRRGATFKEMAAALREHRISGFPVNDDEAKVIGVVSEVSRMPSSATNWRTRSGTSGGVVAVRDEFAYPPAESSFVPGLYS